MKKLLLTAFLTGVICAGIYAQNLIYAIDFEDGLNGASIVGNGQIIDSQDPNHGMVFKNDPSLTNAVRTNYLLLPNNIFADFQDSGSSGLTVSFWVNKSDATNNYWSSMFAAYGSAPEGSNGKPALVLMSRQTGLVNFDYTNSINNLNYGYSAFEASGNQSTAWLDAGGWQFYTFTITQSTAIVYINGNIVNQFQFTGSPTNSVDGLFNVASEIKYITLGGNQAWGWNDPDPAYMFDKLKIYAGALNIGQINSLMNTGQLDAPTLTTSVSAVYLDDEYPFDVLNINGISLLEDIVITAPEGIGVEPAIIPKGSAANAEVSVYFDGAEIIEGVITFKSGDLERVVTVKTSLNAGCFEPVYEYGNMIADPTFSAPSLSEGGFGGWGPLAIDYLTPYCGRGTAYVRGSCWPNGGSLDRALNAENGNELKPNTLYRLRAMLNIQAEEGRYFQFQIEGYNGAESLFFLLGATDGWVQFDTTFVTGETVVTGKGIYFNSCTSSSPSVNDTAFIDNYELYEIDFNSNIAVDRLAERKAYIQNNSIVSEFELTSSSLVTMQVYDLSGKILQSTTKHLDSGFNRFAVHNELPSGVYVMRLFTDEFTQNFKLIVK